MDYRPFNVEKMYSLEELEKGLVNEMLAGCTSENN
jgi:hypothetical protein